jgi:hypothetical protein
MWQYCPLDSRWSLFWEYQQSICTYHKSMWRCCHYYSTASAFAMVRPVHRLSIMEAYVSVHKVNYFVCSYSYNKTEMHYFSNLFWYRTIRVSDSFSVHPQESSTTHTNRYMSYRLCRLLASGIRLEPVWHIPIAVCTVLDSWWWTEKLFETCRVLFQK